MQTVSPSVARSRDIAANVAFIQRASGRTLSPAQRAVQPLAPIFEACKARGLAITPENREVRIRAVNRYFDFLPFDWIEESFKELLADTAAILVVADAYRGRCFEMVTPREKLARKLVELRALQSALTPFALRAADRSSVTLFECPPLDGHDVVNVADAETLARYLSVSIEVARYEQRLARLEVSA